MVFKMSPHWVPFSVSPYSAPSNCFEILILTSLPLFHCLSPIISYMVFTLFLHPLAFSQLGELDRLGPVWCLEGELQKLALFQGRLGTYLTSLVCN